MKTSHAQVTLPQLIAFAVTCWSPDLLVDQFAEGWVCLGQFSQDKKRGLLTLSGAWLPKWRGPNSLMSVQAGQIWEGYRPSPEYGFGWESRTGDRLLVVPIASSEGPEYSVTCTVNGDTCRYMEALKQLGVEWSEDLPVTEAAAATEL